jgi:hypothetical protein
MSRRLFRFAGRLKRPLGPFGPGTAIAVERRLTDEELALVIRWFDPATSRVEVRTERQETGWTAVRGIWPSAVAEPPTESQDNDGDSDEGQEP